MKSRDASAELSLSKVALVPCVQSLSCVQLFATPWTVAHQAHLSIEFPRQAYSMDCHLLLQGIFLDQILNHCTTWPLQGSVSTAGQPRFGTLPDLRDFLT